MTNEPLKVLCIHGVGHGDKDPQLVPTWTKAIEDGIHRWLPGQQVVCDFLFYDELFSDAKLDAATVAEAIAKLTLSGIVHGIGDWLGLSRDFGGMQDTLRWTAGMVAQWADEEKLRAAARQSVLDAIAKYDPRIVVAHSLGSLISYDALGRKANSAVMAGRDYITLGSQIGNPFVRDALGGRIMGLLQADQWFHLYNSHDKAFAAQIKLKDPNFQQVSTDFDIDFLDHDAIQYLTHPNTLNTVWRKVAGPGVMSRALVQSAREVSVAVRTPRRRALLVGINDYPNPANQLEGCVNDVFLMSSILQECGFEAEDIRVVLNDRATASGILQRMQWLLDGAEDKQDRVFFYSGHGAQIPQYGENGKVDHVDECLVPYDFDWSMAKAITDVQFHELYSQLPYDTSFLAIFDCCHSGGMTRDGGPRVRGLAPPDDIRHRMLQWNVKEQMWEERKLEPDNPQVDSWKNKGAGSPAVDYAGQTGATRRLGRAMALRSLSNKEYDAMRKAFDHKGPYLPVLLEACQENQLSYEYRDGATSYGAFTYTVTQIFRTSCAGGKHMTWQQLLKGTQEKLARLKYNQTPVLVGPDKVIRKAIPWK
ncbi:MAG TPA: caspase family protein [Candidatus Dormibacteraeota bacterium]|nr:caspase family protein [Candidatus Dormibacteraeota bacterium]